MDPLSQADLLAIAAEANLAPSVHNTQPTRWGRDAGALRLSADRSRQLRVGDPSGRDLQVSLGAALGGTLIALARRGLSGAVERDETGIRIALQAGAEPDPLAGEVPRRMTWRRGFAAAPVAQSQSLARWAEQHGDIKLVTEAADIAAISALNEQSSLAFYRNAAYRDELLSWMRLSRSDPRFGLDGLSASALGLSAFEALGAGLVLRQPLFGWLDAVGLFGNLMSEARHTLGAAAIALFRRPADEHPVDTGRALYRRQLELSALGFQTWPMSVLADDPGAADELKSRHAIGDDRRLITAWRLGPLPTGAQSNRERLPAEKLIA